MRDGVRYCLFWGQLDTWTVEKEARQRNTDLVLALKSQGVSDSSEYGKLVQDRQRLEGNIAVAEEASCRRRGGGQKVA